MTQICVGILTIIMASRMVVAKPLSGPMLGYSYLDPLQQTSVKCLSTFKHFYWKGRLLNGGHSARHQYVECRHITWDLVVELKLVNKQNMKSQMVKEALMKMKTYLDFQSAPSLLMARQRYMLRHRLAQWFPSTFLSRLCGSNLFRPLAPRLCLITNMGTLWCF